MAENGGRGSMGGGRWPSFDNGPGGTGEQIPAEVRKLLKNPQFRKYWDGRFRSAAERKEEGVAFVTEPLGFDWEEYGLGLVRERQKDLVWFRNYEPKRVPYEDPKIPKHLKIWRTWHLVRALEFMTLACWVEDRSSYLDVSEVVLGGEWEGWEPTPKEYFEERRGRLLEEARVVCEKLWALAWCDTDNKFQLDSGKRILNTINVELAQQRSFVDGRGFGS